MGGRRVFLAGAGILTAGALPAGLAGTAGLLIAARVRQGFGAALMIPSSLSLALAGFPPPVTPSPSPCGAAWPPSPVPPAAAHVHVGVPARRAQERYGAAKA
jgi:MFS family permease